MAGQELGQVHGVADDDLGAGVPVGQPRGETGVDLDGQMVPSPAETPLDLLGEHARPRAEFDDDGVPALGHRRGDDPRQALGAGRDRPGGAGRAHELPEEEGCVIGHGTDLKEQKGLLASTVRPISCASGRRLLHLEEDAVFAA